jgi:molybdopterin molybdotransferase
MDGYAVRAADVPEAGARLAVVGEIRAGAAGSDIVVAPGQAARVFTGAVIPDGADAVVIVERAREEADGRAVRVDGPVARGENVRVRASDRRAGEPVLLPGVTIGAAEIAVLSAVGSMRVRVRRPPVIHLVSTGDELVEPHEVPAPHQIRESNGRMLAAFLADLGAEAAVVGRAPDEPAGLARALGDGLAADLLLVSGGVSVGVYDLVARTLEDLGAETLFHGVAMRPGKPVLAARRGATLIVGLPGNPVSALVGLVVLVAPALRRMRGL